MSAEIVAKNKIKVSKTTIELNEVIMVPNKGRLVVATEDWVGMVDFVVKDGVVYRGKNTNRRRIKDGQNALICDEKSTTILSGEKEGFDVHTEGEPNVYRQLNSKNTVQFNGVLFQAGNNK